MVAHGNKRAKLSRPPRSRIAGLVKTGKKLYGAGRTTQKVAGRIGKIAKPIVGGAIAGGKLAGPKGAAVGAGVGAASVASKAIRKGVKKSMIG